MPPLYAVKHMSQLTNDKQRATESVDSGLQNFRILQGYETSDGLKFILQWDEGGGKYKCINPCEENYGKLRQYLCFCIAIPQTVLLKMRCLPYQTNFREGRSDFTFYSANYLYVYLTLFFFSFSFFLLKVLNIFFPLESFVTNIHSEYTGNYLRSQMK